jgi:hypothetical protein
MTKAGAAFLALVLAGSPCAVRADGGDRTLEDKGSSIERSHDAGVVEGHISSVDRAHGLMTVQSRHGDYDIIVLPSTTIQGWGSDFHTIADLRRDQLVQVFMSRRGKVYFAQIIHLRTER